MKIYSIIPARGGSKGVPQKNIREICGKPLIAYSIEHSLNCDSISRTIVSTDCPEIAAISKSYGAEVPFLRPSNIARDDSTDFEVFENVANFLQERNDLPDIFVHLRPTSPLRELKYTNQAIEILREDPTLDSVRSIISAPQTPYKMWRKEGRLLEPLLTMSNVKEPYNCGRQYLPEVFLQAANIDVIRCSTILHKKSMTGEKIGWIEIPEVLFSDIDTLEDFVRIENVLSVMNKIK